MSLNVYLKDDPDVNKDQISFDFEFIDDQGNVTHTDVNVSNTTITASASWSSLSVGNVSAGSVYTIGNGGSWTWTEPVDPTSDRLDKIEEILRKIQDRLAVIEKVDDIEMKQALKKAYDKYRMVEDMIERKAKE